MSSCGSSAVKQTSVEIIYENVLSSSEEPPMEEWSSLIIRPPPPRPKEKLYKEGLYDPGSGELCGKYIPMSDSLMISHVYYNFPSVIDPGIMEALLDPELKKIYGNDGQELYMDLCKQMNVIPVRSFHRGLLKEVINLRYYCVNPVGVRAMCMSLVNNRLVRRLDLTSNHLSDDACYHLGQLLGNSSTLQELVLSGCRIKAEGTRRLVALLSTRRLDLLDLSKNDIRHEGFLHLASQITEGAVIERLNLSYNGLTSLSALSFTKAIERNNTIIYLDLSWNNMSSLKGSNELFCALGMSKVLEELNVAWNSLTTGVVLKNILNVKTLQVLNLSNNRLSKDAANAITAKLQAARKLHTLDISNNPFSPADALSLVTKMRNERVKLQNLLMEDVAVTKEFVAVLNELLSYSYRSTTKITYGRVIGDYTLSMPDMRDIVMKRIEYITARATKKCKMDIALYFLQEFKERPYMLPKKLMAALKAASVPAQKDLVEEIAKTFPGPKTAEGRQIDLAGVVDYVKRLWPEKRLPRPNLESQN